MAKAQKSGRKFGRNKNRPAGKHYTDARRIANKCRKIEAHLKRQPNDQQAKAALKNGGDTAPHEFPKAIPTKSQRGREVGVVPQDYSDGKVFLLCSEYGGTIDVARSQKELEAVAECGKYHLPLKLYHNVNGKLVLVKEFKGSRVPVSRKDLLHALKNEKRTAVL